MNTLVWHKLSKNSRKSFLNSKMRLLGSEGLISEIKLHSSFLKILDYVMVISQRAAWIIHLLGRMLTSTGCLCKHLNEEVFTCGHRSNFTCANFTGFREFEAPKGHQELFEKFVFFCVRKCSGGFQKVALMKGSERFPRGNRKITLIIEFFLI